MDISKLLSSLGLTEQLCQIKFDKLIRKVNEHKKILINSYDKFSKDAAIVRIAATVLGTMGAAALISALPIVGSLALFVPAMASPCSGIFPLCYAIAALVASLKLFTLAEKLSPSS